MSTILRIIFNAFGFRLRLPSYLSVVSKTIELLPVQKDRKWILGGLVHLLPVLIGLYFIFFLRGSQIQHGWVEKSSLLIASLWAFVGPSVIWYYERYTLPLFHLSSRKSIKDKATYIKIKNNVFSSVHIYLSTKLITLFWMVLVIFGFFQSAEFVSKFGIKGFDDWLWWVLFIGVVLYAYYTSLGFCFAYKSIYLVKLIEIDNVESNIYNNDGVFGFSFIGDFALKTNMMFLSGILMVPLLFFMIDYNKLSDYALPFAMILIYVIYTVCVFIAPIYMVHRKIIKEKELLLQKYTQLANAINVELLGTFDVEGHGKLDFYRSLIGDVNKVGDWPLKFDQGVKFSLSSIILPILASVASAILIST